MFSLDMKYYNLNGKLPHITYEYTVPNPSHDITAAGGIATGPSHSYLNLTYNKVHEDVRGDQLRAANHSRGSVTPVHPYNSQQGVDDQSDVQLQEEEEEEEEGVWEIRTPSPSPPAAIMIYRPADITSRRQNGKRGPPVLSGYRE